MQWTTIERLVDERDQAGLTAALLALTADERKAFAKPLQDKGRVPRGEWLPWEAQPFFALAGAGILASPSALTTWLRRLGLTYWVEVTDPERAPWHDRDTRDVVDDVVRVLEARQVDWLGDLATRLATTIGATRPDHWRYQVVDRLRASAGSPPPDSDGYLVALFTRGGESFVQHVREDPRFAALVPHLVEVDGVGDRISADGARAVAAAVADGALDRTLLLDALLGRLQRGGRVGATRGFLALYLALVPMVDELTGRQRDLVALLSDSPSFLAGVAQEQLAAVDDAARLPAPVLLEATVALLQRTEKKLVRSQLRRLADAVRDGRVERGPAAVAASAAFALAAVDLQRDAVRRVVEWVPGVDDAERDEILLAAGPLPPDLRTEVEQAFGAGLRDDPASHANPLPVVAPPVPFVPAGTLVELAEEFLLLANSRGGLDPMVVERQLEGLVRFARADRGAVREAFAPALELPLYTLWARPSTTGGQRTPAVSYGLVRVLAAAVGDPDIPLLPPDDVHESPFQRAVFERLVVMAADLRLRPGPLVLSTPSDTRGVIEPCDLLDRLLTAAAEGWEPWPDDLDVALLRLDRAAAVGPLGPEAFHALGTDAGQAVAQRLRAPAPGAEVTIGPVERLEPQYSWQGSGSPMIVVRWYLARVGAAPDRERHGRFWSTVTAPRDPADKLRVWLHWAQPFDEPAAWSTALPWHPEIAAVGISTLYAIGVGHANPRPDSVLSLVESPGPLADATALAVWFAASGKAVEARAAATDALVALAAGGRLPPTRLGSVLATLLGGGYLTTTRILGPLRDATESGASLFVWDVLAAALPALVGAAKPIAKLADLLEVAALAASAAGASGSVDGLAEFAARKGSSRQLVEARRLRALLAGGAS